DRFPLPLGEGQGEGARGLCPALDDGGRCSIYPVRPLVCRSHGLPIRLGPPGSLPVIQTCFKNFTAGFDALAPDHVLDQTTLSTLLGAVDAAEAADAGRA